MADVMAIALFRHGLTEANKRHAYLGWSDSPLCEEETLPELVGTSYDVIFTSDLGRCMYTAKRFFPEQKPLILPEFREINFGEWEGKTYEELNKEEQYQHWLQAPLSIAPPSGEAFPAFIDRVDAGFKAVIEKMGNTGAKRAAIVTHGGVIRYLLSKYADEKRGFWEWDIPHDSGYELIWEELEWRRQERCISLQVVPIMENPNGLKPSID